MAHHIPICTNRVFASMVLTASISTTEFVVAQFPVDLKGYPAAFYTENKHKAKNLEPSDSKMKADVIIGSYSSVEHCQKRVNPETNESKIHWIMATASNPGGRIPLALQLLVIPGAIAKDVRFFINWTGKKRLKTSEVYTIEKKQEASTDNRMLAV